MADREHFHYAARWQQLSEKYPELAPALEGLAAFLEDRDRELEAYLAMLAQSSVSVNAPEFTDGWDPAAHAASHEPGGSDPINTVHPNLATHDALGLATDVELAAVETAAANALALNRTDSDALHWMTSVHDDTGGSGTGVDLDEQAQRIMESDGPATQTIPTPATAAVGADVEPLVWMANDGDTEARTQAAAAAAASALSDLDQDALRTMESDGPSAVNYPGPVTDVAGEGFVWMQVSQ